MNFRKYCGGSSLLAWLTLGIVGVWVAVTVVALLGKAFHFYVPVAEWLTLPSLILLYWKKKGTLHRYR